MTRPVVRYGSAVLREPAQEVDTVSADLGALVDDMVATMYAERGIGLAAPQIGVGLRVFVIDLSGGREVGGLTVCINPRWGPREGMQLEEEGCLSLPGFTATVARPASATVYALGRDGAPVTIEGTGLMARALQHEMDHLDGRLFVDRLRGLNRAMILRRIRKLERDGRW